MVQFYFLSILFNILAGLILISAKSDSELVLDDDDEASNKFDEVKESLEQDSFLNNETFCLVTGAICAFVGLIKLFFAYSKTGHGIPVLGDLLPALFGLAGGAIILLEYYSKSFADHELPDFVENVLLRNKMYIGIGCVVAAVLHFILPGIVVF